MTDEKHAVALIVWVDIAFKEHHFVSREQHAYPYKMFHISLRYRELCQEDAVLLGNKMKSPVNQKCCFLLFMLRCKDMQHRSKHHPIVERGATGQNWIPFLFDIHWFHILLYFIAKMAALQHISTKLNFPSWLRGLLSGPCSLSLPDVHIWICTVYRQDLKPKVRIHIYMYIYSL